VENPDMATADHLLEAGDLGNLVLVSGIGLLRSSEHQDEARQLVDFLLGSQAQTYFADEALEYPLAGGAAPAATLAPLDSIGAPAVDLSSLGDLETTVRLIEASGLAGD
jgi:iron(III) transport system substrate-binding protein